MTKEHVEEKWKARDPEEQTGTGKQKCRKCKVKAVATRFAKSFARPSSRLKMIFHVDLKMESMIYSPHNGPSSRTQSAVWPHSACMASEPFSRPTMMISRLNHSNHRSIHFLE